ncbi:acetate--CoA ligase [Scandinavium lactucae]|uniref:Acetate--CoA ligase n=1 Tax=Scandinavium lactucae TaxID=3095028 RepID=A0ABU4QQ05_9ENTR|nr:MULTISPECIES: acetate--CoA ligase [unclassified Scandinavium]MDX6039360.1 acetate--CoA ligase [Scandinavium sp. V105_6]MDX6050431.1 acetate--CoA ligase [Scandinavium sp. V105_1]
MTTSQVSFTRQDSYSAQYYFSITHTDAYWKEEASHLTWMRPFEKIKETSFSPGEVDIRWFNGGKLNVSENCLDRHLKTRSDQAAIIWESDDGKETRTLSYSELLNQVCLFASALLELGIRKGDTVTLYMPMVPETAIAILACARIGAVHNVIFAGFSSDALAERMADAGSKLVITANEGLRGGKIIPLKTYVDRARQYCRETLGHEVRQTIVLKRTDSKTAWEPGIDHWWHELMIPTAPVVEPVAMDAEDPLFILYTSGSTGKAKGLVHTTAGYLVYAHSTFRFLAGDSRIFWCTADVGWITGHTYMLYAPLCAGLTTVMYEGIPGSPSADRLATIIDRHNVDMLYTAPTLIRSLMSAGNAALGNSHRTSLRRLGTVGEPINPEAWRWYRDVFGNGRCPVIDTWWQTETGGIMIAPVSGENKPGAAATPLFGIRADIVDDEGHPVPPMTRGNLVIRDSWPGQARTIYGDHARFEETYFSTVPGCYFTGDGAWQDEDGHFWISGRVDDVLNVSGHRLGTAEIESAITSHPAVCEVAVVGQPHPVKGESVYAFVTLMNGQKVSDSLSTELRVRVREKIGALAVPEVIHWTPYLPKTRSGKILRRVLRKLAAGETRDLGDLSSLADQEGLSAFLQQK